VPPEFSLTDHDVIVGPLMSGGLFIVAEVEETRMIEDLTDFLDQLGTDGIVFLRGDHSRVVAEPCVVARRKIQLRDRLQSHAAQSGEFLSEFFDAPGPFDRQFRVALVLDPLTEIDQDHIQTGGGHLVRDFLPNGIFAEQFVCARRVCARSVSPHIVPQIEHVGPNHLPLFFRGLNVIGKCCPGKECGSGLQECTAGKHDFSLNWNERKIKNEMENQAKKRPAEVRQALYFL